MISNYIKYVFFLGFIQLLVAQAEVQSIGIEARENGLVMTLRVDQPVPQENITGWKAKNDWFYVTLYDVISDSNRLANTAYSYPVRDFQAITMNESSQIGIKLAIKVDQFEFYLSENPPEILVSLRYPVDSVPILAEKSTQNTLVQIEPTIELPPKEPDVQFTSKRMKTIGYFLGTALTVTGLIQQDQDPETPNKELQSGIIILLSTYILDQIF